MVAQSLLPSPRPGGALLPSSPPPEEPRAEADSVSGAAPPCPVAFLLPHPSPCPSTWPCPVGPHLENARRAPLENQVPTPRPSRAEVPWAHPTHARAVLPAPDTHLKDTHRLTPGVPRSIPQPASSATPATGAHTRRGSPGLPRPPSRTGRDRGWVHREGGGCRGLGGLKTVLLTLD